MGLVTSDGVGLHAVHTASRSAQVCVVLAHGFTNSTSTPHVRAIAEHMATQDVGVLAFDFRGHGLSGGASTVGDREVYDVDAAVAAARRLGYRKVVTCGWSMGGTAVIRHAALRGGSEPGRVTEHAPDAVIAVSPLARWYYRETPPMKRVMYAIERRSGRAFARLFLGTRIHGVRWSTEPLSSEQAAAFVAPLPFLVVHGDSDKYFPRDHHARLLDAAAGHATYWVEAGMGHAEKAATPELISRLAEFARAA